MTSPLAAEAVRHNPAPSPWHELLSTALQVVQTDAPATTQWPCTAQRPSTLSLPSASLWPDGLRRCARRAGGSACRRQCSTGRHTPLAGCNTPQPWNPGRTAGNTPPQKRRSSRGFSLSLPPHPPHFVAHDADRARTLTTNSPWARSANSRARTGATPSQPKGTALPSARSTESAERSPHSALSKPAQGPARRAVKSRPAPRSGVEYARGWRARAGAASKRERCAPAPNGIPTSSAAERRLLARCTMVRR